MITRHVVLLTYGEPPAAAFVPQLAYSWRILRGLTRRVAPIPAFAVPLIALWRARFRVGLWRAHAYASPIEAITAEGALDYVDSTDQLVKEVAGLVRGSREDIKAKVSDALERIRQLEKENRQLKDKLASGQGTDLSAGARDIAGVKLVAAQVEGADAGALRNAVDQLKDKLKSAIIVLASVDSANKITLVAGVTPDQTAKVKAGELVGNVAGQVGGPHQRSSWRGSCQMRQTRSALASKSATKVSVSASASLYELTTGMGSRPLSILVPLGQDRVDQLYRPAQPGLRAGPLDQRQQPVLDVFGSPKGALHQRQPERLPSREIEVVRQA